MSTNSSPAIVKRKLKLIEQLLSSETVPVGMSEREARRRKLAAEAAKAELELAIGSGEAIAIADYEREMVGMLLVARNRFLGLAPRLAPELVGLKSAAEAQGVVNRVVREILTDLSESAADHLEEHYEVITRAKERGQITQLIKGEVRHDNEF